MIIQNYKKLSLLIINLCVLASLYYAHAMELTSLDGEEIVEKQNSVLPRESSLECLPSEILLEIMSFLTMDDSAYNYLKMLSRCTLTQEQAQDAMSNFFEKTVLGASSLNKFRKRIKTKYQKLEKSFPNYSILEKTYKKIVLKNSQQIEQKVEHIIDKLTKNFDRFNCQNFCIKLNKKKSDAIQQTDALNIKTVIFACQELKKSVNRHLFMPFCIDPQGKLTLKGCTANFVYCNTWLILGFIFLPLSVFSIIRTLEFNEQDPGGLAISYASATIFAICLIIGLVYDIRMIYLSCSHYKRLNPFFITLINELNQELERLLEENSSQKLPV